MFRHKTYLVVCNLQHITSLTVGPRSFWFPKLVLPTRDGAAQEAVEAGLLTTFVTANDVEFYGCPPSLGSSIVSFAASIWVGADLFATLQFYVDHLDV